MISPTPLHHMVVSLRESPADRLLSMEAERYASGAAKSWSDAGAEAIGGRLVGIGRCLTALSPPQNGACDFHRTPLKHLKGSLQNPVGLTIPTCTILFGSFDSRLIHYARQSLRSGRMDRSFSRDETPDGSQPTFVGDEIIPLCFITKQPSLAPSSFTRSPIG